MLANSPSTLDAIVPSAVPVGGGSAVLLRGTTAPISARSPRLLLDGVEHPLDGVVRREDGADSRLMWWKLLPLGPGSEAPVAVGLRTDAGDHDLAWLALDPAPSPPPRPLPPLSSDPMVAICMATYEPEEASLARQIESIREQTHERWICVISDDASSSEALARIERAIGDDPRFQLERAGERGGFYANFERALRLAPAGVELIALCDQDDRWHPDKLTALVDRLRSRPDSLLAYSDMRVVDGDGNLVSDTYWYESQNSHESLETLAIVNTVTGGASVFRRELLDLALPFPPAFSSEHYHDHWIALCALAAGEITYLDRPTYDYTRHVGSVTMDAFGGWSPPRQGLPAKARHRMESFARRIRLALAPNAWSTAFFDRNLLLRQYALVIGLRLGAGIDPAKRRQLDRVAAVDRSLVAALWLALRALRPLVGRRDTLGRERVLLGALVWRFVAGLRARSAMRLSSREGGPAR